MAEGRYIVVFKDQNEHRISEQAAQQAVQRTEDIFSDLNIRQDSLIHQYKHALKGFAAKLTLEQVELLRKDPRVETVAQDFKYKAIQVIPSSMEMNNYNFFSQTTPWGITRVGGPLNGTGKTAWILDTGIDLDHSDLTVDAGSSVSYVSGESADDLNGHGTHVAGILAAKNNSIGVVGVAAGATVVSVKVCDQDGYCYTSDLDAGIDYVASQYSSGDVANMSLGWPTSGHPYIDLALSVMENTIEDAVDDGLLITIAAGNEKQNSINKSPARVNHANIWTLSSMSSNDSFTVSFSCNSFYGSNYGSPIDYAAPGNNILSLYKNNGTQTLCGTSMAAPHFAGLLLAASNIYADGYVSGDPDATDDAIASSKITVETPNVTASIQSNHPKLSWQTCDNADEYEIWRKVESSGSWTLWTTVSATNYTDFSITDPDMTISIPSGPYDWVAYKVTAVHDDGFESFNSSIIYFETDSIFPE